MSCGREEDGKLLGQKRRRPSNVRKKRGGYSRKSRLLALGRNNGNDQVPEHRLAGRSRRRPII
jgi:hypothetical protein